MKVLVDLPNELYDALRSKTLHLTSGARSNGKHLVYELIGCVMNGAVIKDIQVGDDVFRAYDLMIATGLSTDDDKPVPESKTWSNNEDKIADIEALQPRIIDAVHGTICDFFEPVNDDSGEPMTPFDSRLLTVNKEVCNRIKEIFESYGRKETDSVDNT